MSHVAPESTPLANTTVSDNGFRELKVRRIRNLSETLVELELLRGDIQFMPGDCVSLFSQDGETSRPYSIASGIHEPVLRFLVKTVPGGLVTSFLASRKTGDSIKVSIPYGWFRPGQNIGNAPFIFIATGTGVAPFLSYINSFPENPPAQILYGVRSLQEAAGYSSLIRRAPVRLAISREENPPHYHGRVTGLLADLPRDSHIHYYLCGLDTMIEEVTTFLEKHDIAPINIHREVFFYAT